MGSNKKYKELKCKYCDNTTLMPLFAITHAIFKSGIYTCIKCDIELGRIE